MEEKLCQCDLCTTHRIINKYIPKKEREVVKECFERLMNRAADGDYYSAIIDGSWPSAEEILRNSLKRIEENKKSLNQIENKIKKIKNKSRNDN